MLTPFKDLPKDEQAHRLEEYVTDRMEDPAWVFNCCYDIVKTLWEEGDESYDLYFENRAQGD